MSWLGYVRAMGALPLRINRRRVGGLWRCKASSRSSAAIFAVDIDVCAGESCRGVMAVVRLECDNENDKMREGERERETEA